eukprot:TRINITY_DN113145_c0_g1_i1.p1 TRINITY_DN113145_c0_g1~~TRINITY_DN113145_c0_g1_i1.p1  ORF type:complete len:268 (+),score=53.74 TRINITY_DN113145_c0_g1_i1:42-806(+)
MASQYARGVGIILGGTGVSCVLGYVGAKTFAGNPPERTCPTERARRDTFDGLAKKWDQTVRTDEFLAGLGRARRRLVQRATGDVLEVAVGSGRNFSYYSSGKVTSVTAMDFSRNMLEVAAEKKPELAPIPLKLKLGSTMKMDFEDCTFDTVVDTFGICSFEDPVKALRELRRVVKEDGQVLLLEHGASHWEFVQGFLNRGLHSHVGKYGCYPNRDIIALVKEAGLHIAVEERRHFGTTYSLVCKRNPLVKDDDE